MPPRRRIADSSDAEMEILSEGKKSTTASPRKRKVAAASNEIILSSSSSDEDADADADKPAKKKKKVTAVDDDDKKKGKKPIKKEATASKGTTKASTSKAAPAKKKKKKVEASSSSDEYDEDASASSEEDEYDDDDEEEEDVKPLKGKKKATAAAAATKKATASKPKASTYKAAPAASKSKAASKAVKKVVDDDNDDEEEEAKPKPKWQYKPRAGPAAPGSKEIPIGDEGCLAGLTFVFTGELESLSREAGQDLVKRYGGRVTTAPSSKTSYVVLGSDAGPKKLELIKKHKLKTLDEDGFLGLIGNRKADPNDPKLVEAKKKEEAKVKEAAKALTLAKDAPEHLTQLWTTKYAPQRLADICGNKSQVEKLKKWLENWPKSLACGFKKPGPDAMNTFRCVLISGPPGIGKTTAAHLVAKMLGFDVLELNASDTRSKRLLEEAFRSKVTDTTLSGFFKTEGGGDDEGLGVNNKSLIIMDEVDGMSAGDRGGIGALNSFLKKTKIPIIAIANDSKSQKMKPLINTTFQMLFKRPSAQEVRSRVMSIAFKEGLKLEQGVVDQLVAGSQSDIRQIINMLATYKLGAKAMNFDASKKLAKMNEKNTIQTPWTLYSKLFGPQAFSPVSGLTLNDKLDVYFQDHSIMPLFVQENYLRGRFQRAGGEVGPGLQLKNLELASKAAESISDGDLVDAMIHGTQQQWSLMPLHGMLSCVRPASFCYGQGGGYPNFPAWLGKNSTQGKLGRALGEIQIRMRLRVSGDKREIRQSYLPTLVPRLVSPLVEHGTEGVQEVIELMDQYYLSKEEWDAIVEMGIGEGMGVEQVLKSIPTATKSAFTRKYNSSDHPIPYYKPEAGRAKAKKIAPQGEAPDLEEAFVDEDLAEADLVDDDDEGDSASDGPESFAKDKMIKAKKPKGGAAAAASKKKATATKGKAAKK